MEIHPDNVKVISKLKKEALDLKLTSNYWSFVKDDERKEAKQVVALINQMSTVHTLLTSLASHVSIPKFFEELTPYKVMNELKMHESALWQLRNWNQKNILPMYQYIVASEPIGVGIYSMINSQLHWYEVQIQKPEHAKLDKEMAYTSRLVSIRQKMAMAKKILEIKE